MAEVSRELSAARAAKKETMSHLPAIASGPGARASSARGRGAEPESRGDSKSPARRVSAMDEPFELRETLLQVPPGRALAIQLKKKERRLREELEKVQRAEAEAQKAYADHVRSKELREQAADRERKLKLAEEEEKERLVRAQTVIEDAQKLAERLRQKRLEQAEERRVQAQKEAEEQRRLIEQAAEDLVKERQREQEEIRRAADVVRLVVAGRAGTLCHLLGHRISARRRKACAVLRSSASSS
jgi:hypothetical protein